jgi:hypothetical protein
MKALHLYVVGETDFIVARSPADALKVYVRYSALNGLGLDDVEQLPDDQDFTLTDSYDDPPIPGETKPAGVWAVEHGRGLLASTEL